MVRYGEEPAEGSHRRMSGTFECVEYPDCGMGQNNPRKMKDSKGIRGGVKVLI